MCLSDTYLSIFLVSKWVGVQSKEPKGLLPSDFTNNITLQNSFDLEQALRAASLPYLVKCSNVFRAIMILSKGSVNLLTLPKNFSLVFSDISKTTIIKVIPGSSTDFHQKDVMEISRM